MKSLFRTVAAIVYILVSSHAAVASKDRGGDHVIVKPDGSVVLIDKYSVQHLIVPMKLPTNILNNVLEKGKLIGPYGFGNSDIVSLALLKVNEPVFYFVSVLPEDKDCDIHLHVDLSPGDKIERIACTFGEKTFILT